MDFERAAIKALFYDYPIEAAVKALKVAETFGGKDVYLDRLPEFIRWREQAFTTTETRLMEELAKEKWLQVDGRTTPSDNSIYQALNMVNAIAKDLLMEDKSDHNYPLVQFDRLFRWKDVTLYVGEDLLTTALVAANDANNINVDEEHKLLLWPDYIHHDEKMLNEVLDKSLSDVHAHFYASADVFHFNWISLMNALKDKGGDNFKDLRHYQDVMLTTADTENIYTLKSLCVAGAYLRLLFFKQFVKKDKGVSYNMYRNVIRLLEDDFYARSRQADIQAEISVARMDSLHTPRGSAMDYAIVVNNETMGKRDDIHMIFQGERQLMYMFLLRYYRNCPDAWVLAPYFYLYLLIKTRMRKEIVQINSLKGFENFETYQDRKDLFTKQNEAINAEFGKYMLQTTIRKGKNDHVEARITPGGINVVTHMDYEHSVFSRNRVLPCAENKISFVVHFIKANPYKHKFLEKHKDNICRYARYRAKLKTDIDKVLKAYEHQMKYPVWDKRNHLPQVVGIDAASTEMFCRPEVFGHVYRYAKAKGIYNRTYHVGEDFFDIVGGLRAIDEAILFLDLDSNCRIGHALAIGVNALQYYVDRKFRIIGSQQEVLDNCVWLLMRASEHNVPITNALETQLTQLARKLYLQIRYDGEFSIQSYWNSMLLRGNEPLSELLDDKESVLTDWQMTQEVSAPEVKAAMKDMFAKKLYQQYHFDAKIKEEGDKHTDDKYSEEIVQVVTQVQRKMQEMISQKNIAIECNPTSNLKIGFFKYHKDHPLLTRFEPLESKCVDPIVNASVNTDDRGVFATTVYNELSLLALALKKEDVECEGMTEKGHYNPRAICEYIGHIRENGVHQQFKVRKYR